MAASLRDAGTGLFEPARFESITYDAQGRIASVTTDEGTVSYQYDHFGRLASTTIGTPVEPQRIISYTYDPLGRLKTVSEDQDPADSQSETLDTAYGYTLLGSLRRTDLPNGTIEKYVYDALGRLIEEDFDSSNDSLDYIESFLFDLASNRVQKTRDLGRNQTIDETTTYEYDANDCLWSEAVDRLLDRIRLGAARPPADSHGNASTAAAARRRPRRRPTTTTVPASASAP